MSDPVAHRRILAPLRAAMYDWTEGGVRAALRAVFANDATFHMCHPFGDLTGAHAFHDAVCGPLHRAMPDVERRDWITMAGRDESGADWIGAGGTYVGTFVAPFLDIPPTGHLAHMRFHEYFRVVDGRIAEMQAIWDIPELMMQARAWPMAPSLGRDWAVPGPITQDGLRNGPYDDVQSAASRAHVTDMLAAMVRHPREPVAAMQLDRFWHPRFTWYGPAGIGTGRGVSGFRNWHQVPFLSAMPDRGRYPDEVRHHFFADGPYVAVTGWPDMMQTISGAGWLGIAASGQKVAMRSLDFWRIEAGLIRENWVLVDLLHMYDQIGVDVLGRMREFNRSRRTGPVALADEVR